MQRAAIPTFMPVALLSLTPIITPMMILNTQNTGESTFASLSDGSVLQLISIKLVGKSVLTPVFITGSSSSKIPLPIISQSTALAMFSRQYLSF